MIPLDDRVYTSYGAPTRLRMDGRVRMAEADARTAEFSGFYASEYATVLRVAIALTGDLQAAEDVAGDVFVDAYRRWSKIGAYEDPGAWARRAAANRASNHRRGRMYGSRLMARIRPRRAEEPPALPDDELWQEVRKLPQRQAQVIVLHYIEQLSVQEIADLLDISEASIKTHLQRARSSLAGRLQTGSEHE